MIHRIVEAFTRPRWQLTAMDELWQAITVIVIILAVVGILAVIGYFCKPK
jgi:hypothetical protein